MGEEYFKIKKKGKTLNIKILKRSSAKKINSNLPELKAESQTTKSLF